MICSMCKRRYEIRGKGFTTEILDPWDCSFCNRDTYYKIQQDVNFLYSKFGYRSTYSVYPRLNRLFKKQFLQPIQ